MIIIILFARNIDAQELDIKAPQDSTPPLENPFKILNENLSQNNYLKALTQFKNRETEYLNSPFKMLLLEFMVLINTYLNLYDQAYKYETKLIESSGYFKKVRERNSTEINFSPIDSFKMVSASEAVLQKAATSQVLMINEEHRQPLHRSFLYEMLPGLYKKGFRYLAVETLTVKDSLLNKRGYAIQASGFYTADPVFGNLIREASDLGFTIVAYDYEGDYPEESSPDQRQEIREKGQAENIISRILKDDPAAKTVVFAGRAHIAETKTPNFSFMAWHFKEMSNIDPYTIDQVQLSERNLQADEVPLFKYIVNTLDPKNPVAFAKDDNSYWSGTNSYDMRIFHPRTSYVEGRPDWLYFSSLRTPVEVDLEKLNLPVVNGKYEGQEPVEIQAFMKEDVLNAVPADIVVIFPGDKVPVLLLSEGEVKVQAKNNDGEVLNEYFTSVVTRAAKKTNPE